jgi:hypothetical protein
MAELTFKRVVENALIKAGFFKHGKAWLFKATDVSIVIATQSAANSRQTFINVGFWLSALGEAVPEKVELTHMYYSLERLFPQERDAILIAGDNRLAREVDWSSTFASVLDDVCLPGLKSICSMAAIRAEFSAGKLSGGLIRKEARALLESKEGLSQRCPAQ